jgi:glycosyltransferase involved in cell wall biosynthesis
MKIGIYDPYLDDLGGGEKYMMTLASCLADDNDVYTFWNDPSVLHKLEERFNIDLAGVKFKKNIFSREVSFIEKILETKKYDIIIALSDGSIPLSFSKKTFLHLQQPMPGVSPNLVSHFKLKMIRGVFCNSVFTKSYIDKELGINSKVLYPPVILKPINSRKENIILHVGRFRAKNMGGGDYKKQGFMVDTFKKMVDSGLNNWKLVIAVGLNEVDEESFGKLKFDAEDYPIEFLVNKTNEELWIEYSKAKIYWHASGYGENLQEHPEYAEHFGISTVEAMGAGVVPVVINAGGQKEIVQNGENGILWNNEEELIEKTSGLIKNEDMLKELSVKARNRALFFAGDRFCRQAREIILS